MFRLFGGQRRGHAKNRARALAARILSRAREIHAEVRSEKTASRSSFLSTGLFLDDDRERGVAGTVRGHARDYTAETQRRIGRNRVDAGGKKAAVGLERGIHVD